MSDDIIIVEVPDDKDILVEQTEDQIIIIEENQVTEVIVEENIGPAGDAATISIGSTTTLAPGSAATVSNSGTAQNVILNFGIPEGSKWYYGAGVPSAGLGLDGDLYVRTVGTYPFYIKISGVWVSQGPLQGPTGPTGPTGANGTDATRTRPQIHHTINSETNFDPRDTGFTFICDTSGGHFAINLPALVDVDVGVCFYVKDATGSFESNALVLGRLGGSDSIDGLQMNKELRTSYGHWCIWAGEDSWWVGN